MFFKSLRSDRMPFRGFGSSCQRFFSHQTRYAILPASRAPFCLKESWSPGRALSRGRATARPSPQAIWGIHAKTTECNPLPSQIVGDTVHKHSGTRVMCGNPYRHSKNIAGSFVSFQIIWRLLFHAIWRVMRRRNAQTGGTCGYQGVTT